MRYILGCEVDLGKDVMIAGTYENSLKGLEPTPMTRPIQISLTKVQKNALDILVNQAKEEFKGVKRVNLNSVIRVLLDFCLQNITQTIIK